jgi:hypothetical protein
MINVNRKVKGVKPGVLYDPHTYSVINNAGALNARVSRILDAMPLPSKRVRKKPIARRVK